MNVYLILAACLTILVAIVHSILGEILVFKKLRENRLVPTLRAEPLTQGNIRIIWATWHLASVFGVAIAYILFDLSQAHNTGGAAVSAIAGSMSFASLLVCYSTKARHPGWIGLLTVALLCWLA